LAVRAAGSTKQITEDWEQGRAKPNLRQLLRYFASTVIVKRRFVAVLIESWMLRKSDCTNWTGSRELKRNAPDGFDLLLRKQ
jgi:hypothetical protein